MFLTRLGFGSKAVVTGDITQIDLPQRAAVGPGRGAEGRQGRRGHRLHLLRRPGRRAPQARAADREGVRRFLERLASARRNAIGDVALRRRRRRRSGARRGPPGLGALARSRVAPARARGAVTVALVPDARVRALNRRYRRKDRATDVLSFPAERAGRPRRCRDCRRRCAASGAAGRPFPGRPSCGCWRCTACCTFLAMITSAMTAGWLALERRLRRKGGLREGLIERGRARTAPDDAARSLPARRARRCSSGSVQAAFSALMRLSLRLMAERGGRGDRLGQYLDDPLQLFIPVRILIGVCTVLAGVLIARVERRAATRSRSSTFIVSLVAFVVVCEHLLPLLIVRRDPERVLDVLLPAFHADRAAAGADDARCSSTSSARARRARAPPTAADADAAATARRPAEEASRTRAPSPRRKGASCCSRSSTSPRPSCAR